MSSKILINAVDSEECRIARVTDRKLDEFQIETTARAITQGNIYKGVVARIEPSLQAAFVDYGVDRHGFLQKHEIHPDYYLDPSSADRSIKSLIKRGQELLVQVVKDPIQKKGAMLTTLLSLAGRYVVLMPGSDSRGISRKIEDEAERSRLKEILGKLSLPEGYGTIIRTAGVGATKTAITKDLNDLIRLWKGIRGNVMQVGTPFLMHKERSLALRAIRDYFTGDITEILIDDAAVHREVKDFLSIISPKHSGIVKLYKEAKPIFSKYQLEDQIASIYEPQVRLKSGGSIVIAQTEALVAIDVNSGKATSGKSVEQTALTTNLEAAEEIARQLRMRDLGGLIVLDFIDMKESKHKLEVERAMKAHVKPDKAKTKIGRITRFGLMEMSRQRLRPSIEFGSRQICPHCAGKGLVASPESLGLSFLRRLHLEVLKPNVTAVHGRVPLAVADYLLNKKRRELLELEAHGNLTVSITGDPRMVPGQSEITCDP